MALIACPECGKTILDKATKYPHCGKILVKETKVELNCRECGNVLSEKDKVCPVCGCPVQEEKNDEQNVAVTSVKVKVSSKSHIYI